MQIQMEKIGLKKYQYFKKVLRFNISEYLYRRGLQSAKHLLIEYHLYTEKKYWYGKRQKENGIREDKLARDANQLKTYQKSRPIHKVTQSD